MRNIFTKSGTELCGRIHKFKILLNVKNKTKKTIQFENFSIWHVGFFFFPSDIKPWLFCHNQLLYILGLTCFWNCDDSKRMCLLSPRRCCNQTYAKPNLCVWSTQRWRGRVFSSREQWAVRYQHELAADSITACMSRTHVKSCLSSSYCSWFNCAYATFFEMKVVEEDVGTFLFLQCRALM